MPQPVAHLVHAAAIFFVPDLAVEREIRYVAKIRAKAQLCIATRGVYRRFQRAEITREIQMLLDRQVLIGEHQDAVSVERCFNRTAIVRA